ncbi:MbcA/ParS/Xre antitoxin family protein [Pseudogemmobacter sonorensis]|uniref:MbcA/ParS/Xre antitoxin family protein n=1 Tax=Pseudogemmobacter sonorensis TaxID=2989681 RepID=UPI0036938072
MLQELQRTASAPDVRHLTDEEARASARAVTNLFRHWELSDDEACDLLGGISSRTWARWKAGEIGRIDRDLATRLSLFLGIHKALRYMFGHDAPRLYGWIRRENAAFGGDSALNVVRRGQLMDLYRVRQYLDAERGGW